MAVLFECEGEVKWAVALSVAFAGPQSVVLDALAFPTAFHAGG